MSCGACTGVCCVAFPWNRSPAQLQHYPAFSGGHTQEESRYISAMLIPLSKDEAKERHERFGVIHSQDKYDRNEHWYTCKHWDEDTKLCGAYESRPKMCQEFPYAKACEHGCGYELPPKDRAIYDRREIEEGRGPLEIILGEN